MILTDKITMSVEFIKNFINRQYVFILFSFIVLIGLGLLAQIPYINLLLTPENIASIYWLLIILFFRPKICISFLLATILLMFAIVLIIIGLDSVAEKIGNIIYFLLVIGFMQSFLFYTKTVKHNND